jgi:hypothetical protein
VARVREALRRTGGNPDQAATLLFDSPDTLDAVSGVLMLLFY